MAAMLYVNEASSMEYRDPLDRSWMGKVQFSLNSSMWEHQL